MFAVCGGEPLNAPILVASLRRHLAPKTDANAGDDDLFDDDAVLGGVLLFHVGDDALGEDVFCMLGRGKIVELGWDCAVGAPTPTVAFSARLGLAANAWLALRSDAAVVFLDGSGDRGRVGMACALALRVAAAVSDGVSASCDCGSEGYEKWLSLTQAPAAFALQRLPPSFGRALRHVDFAVEARALPNGRPLQLLGVSVRGLPLSDAPVLDVARPKHLEQWSSDNSAVEWDGDEAFYPIENVVIRGDFALLLRFGGSHGAVLDRDCATAVILRYVASSAFLCDGAIDVRKNDVDIHPAYKAALDADSGNDFRIRMALRYADDADDADAPAPELPRDQGDAEDRGLAVISAYHAVSADAACVRSLLAQGFDGGVSAFALQLCANDVAGAKSAIQALPALQRASRALKAHADVFEARPQRMESAQPVAAAQARIFGRPKKKRLAEPAPAHLEAPALLEMRLAKQEAAASGASPTGAEAADPPTAAPSADAPATDAAEASRQGPAPVSDAAAQAAVVLAAAAAVPPAAPGAPESAAPEASARRAVATPRVQAEAEGPFQPPCVEKAGRSSEPQGAAVEPALARVAPQMEAASQAGPSGEAAVPSQGASPQGSDGAASDGAASIKAQSAGSAAAAPSSESAEAPSEAAPSSESASSEAAPLDDGAPSAEASAEAAAAAASEAAIPAAIPLLEGVALGDYPQLKPFVRLLKVGLPRPAVDKKMVEDGLNPLLLDFDLSLPPTPAALDMLSGLEASPASRFAKPPDGAGDARKRRGRRQSLKPVHWEPYAASSVEGTVWASKGSAILTDEKQDLLKLFAVDAQASFKVPKPQAEDKMLDAKRKANVAIGLSKLGKLFDDDFEALITAASCLDASKLTLENVEALIPLLPTEAEACKFREAAKASGAAKAGDAARANDAVERFFYETVHAVDSHPALGTLQNLKKRLACFADALQAPEAAEAAMISAAVLVQAADAARYSPGLQDVLKRLLDVGNALNEGTARGGAAGFKLSSLQRISGTKSADNATTVLEFAARRALVDEAALVDLAAPLRAAARLSVSDLESSAVKARRLATQLAGEADQLRLGPDALSKRALINVEQSLERCASLARRVEGAVEKAAKAVEAAAKYFGDEDGDAALLFGTLAALVDAFSRARAAAATHEVREREAADAVAAKREQREKRRKSRKHSVDDILGESPAADAPREYVE